MVKQKRSTAYYSLIVQWIYRMITLLRSVECSWPDVKKRFKVYIL